MTKVCSIYVQPSKFHNAFIAVGMREVALIGIDGEIKYEGV